jgi:stage V sporulation protein AD
MMNAQPELEFCAAVTSSHNASAERQFRTPLEYGGQRAKTAQWTATASGAFILGRESGCAVIKDVMIGIPRDGATTDSSNMGPSMAFAAADTILSYFEKSDLSPSDFDFIVTGDLGKGGSSLLRELLLKKDKKLSEIHLDFGNFLYDKRKQDCHSGASGCGTSASVLASYFLPMLKRREIKRILFLSTGALMNTTTTQQGENIIGIAPALRIEIPI